MSAQIALMELPEARPGRLSPAKPILRSVTYQQPPRDIRLGLVRVWGPGRKLCWLTHYPDGGDGRRDDLTVKRMISWSYQAGYHGLLVVSLYPKVVKTRRAAVRWRQDPATTLLTLLGAAADAGRRARRLNCQAMVVATGALSSAEADDLEAWIEAFRAAAHGRPGHWLCLGLGRLGWPVAPARKRQPQPLPVSGLLPWHLPNRVVERRDKPAVAGGVE